ncbi:MAG: response regulator [Nitrospirota bacterium]
MKKILIIDDEPNIIEIIHFFISELGYSSDRAHSGESALEKIKQTDYWAIMCDLQMPGLNGMQIYDHVNEIQQELSQKFILLTGSLLDESMETKATNQNIKVLMKPFHFENVKKIFSDLETATVH